MIYGINNLKNPHLSMKGKIPRISLCEFSRETAN